MIEYKFDVLTALTAAGYSSYKLGKEKILSNQTIQRLRHDEQINMTSLNIICRLLHMQPGDILRYVDDEIPDDEL